MRVKGKGRKEGKKERGHLLRDEKKRKKETRKERKRNEKTTTTSEASKKALFVWMATASLCICSCSVCGDKS